MKNKTLAALTALVLLFGGFTSGFFLGRNARVDAIRTTASVPESTPVLSLNPTVPVQTDPRDSFPVNINTADLSQLSALPGIGEVLGQRIIDYRSAHGPFSSVEELINVRGIGENRLAELRPYVTV